MEGVGSLQQVGSWEYKHGIVVEVVAGTEEAIGPVGSDGRGLHTVRTQIQRVTYQDDEEEEAM